MKKYMVLFAVVVLSVLFVKTSYADHDPFNGVIQTSVTICHSAGNSGNFVTESPNISGTGANINLMGHEGNQGTHGGDVIPPFHWSEGLYSGKNWNNSNEAIWRNGCNAVTSSPTPTVSPTASPSVTPSPTATATGTATPSSSSSPTPTPTASPEPTPNDDVCANIDGIQNSVPNDYHLDASGRNCVQFGVPGAPTPPPANNGAVLGASTVKGQVLGTSTMAKTGVVEDSLFNSIFTLGSLLTSFGIMKNGKKKA